MDKKERFNKLIRYIIWKFDVPFQCAIKTIAEKVGVGSSNLSTALRGNIHYLTDNIMKKVNDAYGAPVRIEWLLMGSGEMFPEGTGEAKKDDDPVVASQQATIARLTETVENLAALLKQQV